MPLSTAFSDCAEGVYRTRATVRSVLTFVNGEGASVELELPEIACGISFDVSRFVDDWPVWPWLFEGAQLDIDLWDTGGNTRGGDPLWLILRDSVTRDPLLSIHQLNGALIREGQFRNELGIDAAIVGPVCEDTHSAEAGLLIRGYNLGFASQGKRITLGPASEGSLPSSNTALVWRIQTGVLENDVLEPTATILDVRPGEYFQIVAWPEPR